MDGEKRIDLVKDIRRAAKAAGKDCEVITGGRHDKIRIGTLEVPLARHKWIPPGTARGIRKDLEPELGKDWWR